MTRFRAVLGAVALSLALSGSAWAVDPAERLADPALESRARSISAELRCLVCQNQSIDDSDAPLARDLRVLVRDRLKTGASDAEIRDYLVRRYGEFVLLKPVMGPHTALLWWGPPLLLLVAAFAVFRLRRRGPGAVPPLSPEEEQRLRALSGS